ncbi:predicted NUDIX hydrolase [Alteracholeplasma palmae J233]|uniref:Predicted NUDIX hydrolase n=1 Tax=Alteracholeplasma palmae (strain ATCC 49389 / J233) TaxID=1318466 RepID=U4KJJ9_ALTPJ|nr:NUDIX domain-containing protein [Alteracholeplasma palmae]CCV63644.1 predicted NUDIX hydrolase [Alteracholeplasma palmae J233]
MNYCPNCGNKLEIRNEKTKECLKCGYIDWNNLVNVSSIVVAYYKDQFVMVRLKENNKITFPGGYRDLGETLEEAARREFFEETGMTVNHLDVFKTYTKDSQHLVWIVYKASIEEVSFIDNNETSEIILVKDAKDILQDELRGNLTKQLFDDLV